MPPTLTSLEPNTAALSDPDFTIRCLGDGFDETSKIIWMGAEEPTALVSPTEVTTLVGRRWLSSPTTIDVLIRNLVDLVPEDSETLVFTWTAAVAPPVDDHYADNPQLPPPMDEIWPMFLVAATHAIVPYARNGVDFSVSRASKAEPLENTYWNDALLGPRPTQEIEDEAKALAAQWPSS